MILAVDIGNTNVVLAIGSVCRRHQLRLETNADCPAQTTAGRFPSGFTKREGHLRVHCCECRPGSHSVIVAALEEISVLPCWLSGLRMLTLALQ